MKMAKKRVRKASPKPKPKGKPEEARKQPGGVSLLRETWGLLLLSVALVTVIALLSDFALLGPTNLLGPYLGDWWADTLNRFAGSLPVLFLVAAVAMLGFKLVLSKAGLRVHLALALVLLFVATGVLLSVKNIGKDRLADLDYQVTGGYLGNFLVQKCLVPVFGREEFGPYLVTSIAILFIFIWGFRLSVVALSEKSAAGVVLVVRPFLLGLSHLWSRPPKPQLASLTAPPVEPLPAPTRKAMAAEAKALAAEASKAIPAPRSETLKKKGEAPEKEPGQRDTGPRLPQAGPIAVPSRKLPVLSQNNYQAPKDDDVSLPDDLDDLDLNDPLAIRKIRDLDLERKRVSELNDWEIKSRSPEIAGMLLKEKTRERGKSSQDGNAGQEPPGSPTAPRGDAGQSPEGKSGKRKGRREAEEEAPAEILANVAPESDGLEPRWETGAYETTGVLDAPRKPVPKPAVQYDPYCVPSIDDIFAEPPKQPLEFTEEELREQSKLLEDQLINFKVMGKVTQICPGPVITRYEVELAPGVKVNRISNLADDLALALRAKSIRILAPIPGKSVVGIEVPNRKAQIVYIKEILRAQEFTLEEDTLKLCLGKTIGGEPYVMDLTRAPHLLIAGQTGSGKSVCINSIMASFLCSKTPDELRMILVDPKVVELKPYDAIPHLLYPVITQPDVAVSALKWATVEMDRRYEVLAMCGVRNIKGFNQKFREGKLSENIDDEDRKLMPYMVIIIDELADLMMVAGKEVETNIARIAQKARAVGIHLILATQRPSTNVITGTIKANLPTRIAFQVASQIDARTIMDKMGAEKLLGRGDMLFRPIEFPEPIRLHGCYVDDDQAEKLALSASDQFVNYPQITSFNLEDDPGGGGGSDEPRDEKFREAAELVVQVKQASVSLLQRRLGIGYARSGRLVDQLERAGVVGKERGSKPREVLMNPEELQSFLSSGLNDD